MHLLCNISILSGALIVCYAFKVVSRSDPAILSLCNDANMVVQS